MTTASVKKELHRAIENIDDTGFLKAVFKIVNEKSKAIKYELTDEQWEEIERRRALHKTGKSKSYSWEETKSIVAKRLK